MSRPTSPFSVTRRAREGIGAGEVGVGWMSGAAEVELRFLRKAMPAALWKMAEGSVACAVKAPAKPMPARALLEDREARGVAVRRRRRARGRRPGGATGGKRWTSSDRPPEVSGGAHATPEERSATGDGAKGSGTPRWGVSAMVRPGRRNCQRIVGLRSTTTTGGVRTPPARRGQALDSGYAALVDDGGRHLRGAGPRCSSASRLVKRLSAAR